MSGLHAPKGFDNAVVNGSDREVVITPGAGKRVTLYGVAYDDASTTPTLFQIFAGGAQVFTKSAVAAGEVVSMGHPQSFGEGVVVIARLTATTTGGIHVSAAVHP